MSPVLIVSVILRRRLIQSTKDCVNAGFYFSAYAAKAELSTHSIMSLTKRAFIGWSERYNANPDCPPATEDVAHKLIVRSVMLLIGSVEISGPLAALTLMRKPWLRSSHEFEYIPFGGARQFLSQTRMSIPSAKAHAGEGSETNESESSTLPPSELSDDDMNDITAIIEPERNLEVPSSAPKLYSCSKVMDYSKRPIELEQMGFVEYLLCTAVVRATKDDIDSATGDVQCGAATRRGRKKVQRYTYMPDHPRYTSHVVVKRSDDPMNGRIPNLTGGQIPERNVDDELYCLSVLVLFVPWRNAGSFITTAVTTWTDAYLQHVTTVQSATLKPWVCNYLNNVQLLHTQGRSRNADIRNREVRERELLGNSFAPSTNNRPKEGSSSEAEDNNFYEDLLVLLSEQVSPADYNVAEQNGVSYVERAINALKLTPVQVCLSPPLLMLEVTPPPPPVFPE